jgi:hypothetical protein
VFSEAKNFFIALFNHFHTCKTMMILDLKEKTIAFIDYDFTNRYNSEEDVVP